MIPTDPRGVETGVKGKLLGILTILCCAAISMQCESKETRSFSTPFIEKKAPHQSKNIHVAQVTHKPIIYVEITNPVTRKSMKGYGILDTGADNCFIRKDLAERLGLVGDGQPPHDVFTGAGKISIPSTTVEFTLTDPRGEAVKGFPVQTTHLFISEGAPFELILGNNGFLDRFKEVRISYPLSITLIW